MIPKSCLLILLFLIFSSITVYGQTVASNTLGFTAYPTAVSSLGMGNNSVAFTSADDALTFNPANLIFNKGVTLSYLRNPLYVGSHQYPFTNLNFSFTIPSIGVFSLEYRNQSFGEIAKTTVQFPDGTGETYKPYNRSYSIGYARYITDEISIGAGIRYAGQYIDQVELTGFLFSLGANYNPNFWESRLSVGFSIMNLGSAIEYEQQEITVQQVGVNRETIIYTIPASYFPPPSYLNLGANIKYAKNNFYSSSFQLAFTKPIIEQESVETYLGRNEISGLSNAKSSFKSLFSDWDDFPRDVNLHTGIAFEWEPISLGNNFIFLQEMYLGNYSEGIVNGNSNLLTHGINIGVGYKNVQLKFGYSGIWHNAHTNNVIYYYYLSSGCPKESWQFSLNWKTPEFLSYSQNTEKKNRMRKINLLAGAGYSLKVGDYSEPNGYTTNDNNFSYYLEADFYFSKTTALVSNFTYSPFKNIRDYKYSNYKYETELENISLSSSIRYHFLDSFSPIYVQTGFGICRMNPIQNSTPKYSYKTFFTNKVGASFELNNNLILQPEVDWILLVSEKNTNSNLLYGLSQFDFSIKFGYSF